jgi:hypothetical protein
VIWVQDGLSLRYAHLEAEDLWLHERERFAVDLDEAFAFLAVGDRGSYILSVQVHI